MQEIELLMKKFCNIIIPGHDNKPGYINVKKKVLLLGKDRRTYYNWKNGDSQPSLKTMLKLLNEKGYTLEITLSKSCFK